jgi:hypothetical protein
LKYLTRKRLSNYLIQGFIALKGDSGLWYIKSKFN